MAFWVNYIIRTALILEVSPPLAALLHTLSRPWKPQLTRQPAGLYRSTSTDRKQQLTLSTTDRLTCQRQILRSPGFHNTVRRIHRKVQDQRYGRDPNEPLHPGEATELPGPNDNKSFPKYFVEELMNQFRGSPTNPPPPPGPPRKPR